MTRKWLLIPWLLAITVSFLGKNEPFPDGFLFAFLTYDTTLYEGYSLSLFSLLGVFPLALFPLLWTESAYLRPHPLPFALSSFVIGGFLVAPYLAFARTRETGAPPKPFATKPLGLVLIFVTLALFVASVFTGDIGTYVGLLETNQFIRTMSADFLLLSCIQAVLMVRDGKRFKQSLTPLPYIPLLGLLFWLIIRPRERLDNEQTSEHL